MQFQDNYPLKNVTTLNIGGPAKKFVAVKTQEELIGAIKFAKDQNIPYLVIGGGSNLLVADEGVDCLVIKNEITGINYTPPRSNFVTPRRWPHGLLRGGILIAKSGTSLQSLVDYTISHGLAGLEKLSGIPGTVGGAVYGNAGAYGQSISDYLTQVSVLDSSNLTIKQFNNLDCGFTYRNSIFKQNHFIVLEITFQLETGDPEMLEKEAKDTQSRRLVKYPPGIKCAGSFFKNLVVSQIPEDIFKKIPQEKIVYGKLPAGSLLEEVGAKGKALDGIEISPKHANLFINKDGGTAKAFCELAKKYAQKVKEKFGITLEPEVQLINLPPLI